MASAPRQQKENSRRSGGSSSNLSSLRNIFRQGQCFWSFDRMDTEPACVFVRVVVQGSGIKTDQLVLPVRIGPRPDTVDPSAVAFRASLFYALSAGWSLTCVSFGCSVVKARTTLNYCTPLQPFFEL